MKMYHKRQKEKKMQEEFYALSTVQAVLVYAFMFPLVI